MRAKAELVRNFIKILRKLDGTVEEFDPGLWGGMVEKVTVHSKDKVDFTFKVGYTPSRWDKDGRTKVQSASGDRMHFANEWF